MKKEIEVFVQILLLVGATFAFAHIVDDAFAIVSAQEISEEAYESLRQMFPALSDEGILEVLENLEEQGYLSEEDFDNPAAVENALDMVDDAYDNIGENDNGLLSFLEGLIPDVRSIDGDLFQSDLLDETGGLNICPETVDGGVCQPMLGVECSSRCKVDCVPGDFNSLDDEHECKLGTCYDEDEGSCEARSPKLGCDVEGVTWHDDPNGNVAQCVKGCCSIADQNLYLTERQCEKKAESVGVEFGVGAVFSSGGSELECLIQGEDESEGACVLESTDGNDCKFTTNIVCDSIDGDFSEGLLCSNEYEINTICERQVSTGCVEGLDEVYWFDSCGNRENIFEGKTERQKRESWNEGKIREKEDSCRIGSGSESVRYQDDCGNCDSLKSSICAEERTGQELDDNPDGGFVCIDMGCPDAPGGRREHGESWCAYQSSIGLPGKDIPELELFRDLVPENPITQLLGGVRATDTPGSSHFRKSCLNGEIVTEACGNYRNQICEELQTENGGDTFSQASCRINRWQECLAYNPSMEESRLIGSSGKLAGDLLKTKLELTCGADPDCFVKTVDARGNSEDTFYVSYCAPRYPPGFDYKDGKEPAGQICAQASNECTVIYVKQVSGEWKCEHNCDCEDEKFAQQMNEFCTSLGDCGYSVNYVGELPGADGYSLSEKEGGFAEAIGSFLPDFGGFGEVSANPLDANPTEGEYIQSSGEFLEESRGKWINDIFGGFDIIGLIDSFLGRSSGGGGYSEPNYGEKGLDLAVIPGAMGGALYATQFVSLGTTAIGLTSKNLANLWPAYGGYAGAALGAAAGAAIVGFLIDITGIGPGLNPGLAYGLIGAGAVSGAVIGASLTTTTTVVTTTYVPFLGVVPIATETGGAACAFPPACIVAIAVIVIIVILAIAGVGEIDERNLAFECKPWVPPLIGDCESCGVDELSDGSESFPCNKYACESLGQNCEYLVNSEGVEGGQCIGVEREDVSEPVVVELSVGEDFRIVESSSTGVKIRRKTGNECLSQFESLTYEFTLDEHGRCAYSFEKKNSFEEMTAIPGGLLREHSHAFSSLDLIGVIDFEQGEIEEVGLYLECEDYFGNKNLETTYIVNICIDPEDWMAPLIRISDENILLPFNAEEHEISIVVNEPSDVRWSFNDVPFDQMEGEFSCDFESRYAGGFICTATIPVDSSIEDIFVRASDHPEWDGTEDEANRNENQESVHIVITRSDNELVIDSINPNGILNRGLEISSVDIEVRTSGGGGDAVCYLSIDNRGEDQLTQSGGNTHRYVLDYAVEGVYVLGVRCIDEAGNIAERNAQFEIRVENENPNIARVYALSGRLYVVTNERAECAYNNNNCGFSFDDGLDMSATSNGLLHNVGFNVEDTYYVKCRDEFGNGGSGCDIVVSGGLF